MPRFLRHTPWMVRCGRSPASVLCSPRRPGRFSSALLVKQQLRLQFPGPSSAPTPRPLRMRPDLMVLAASAPGWCGPSPGWPPARPDLPRSCHRAARSPARRGSPGWQPGCRYRSGSVRLDRRSTTETMPSTASTMTARMIHRASMVCPPASARDSSTPPAYRHQAHPLPVSLEQTARRQSTGGCETAPGLPDWPVLNASHLRTSPPNPRRSARRLHGAP